MSSQDEDYNTEFIQATATPSNEKIREVDPPVTSNSEDTTTGYWWDEIQLPTRNQLSNGCMPPPTPVNVRLVENPDRIQGILNDGLEP